MAANAEIFFEHDRWGRNLAWSLGLHIAIAGAIVLYAVVAPSSSGEGWGAGGGGDAMGVTLVSTRSPARQSGTNRKRSGQRLQRADPVAAQAGKEKEPDAIPIPGQDHQDKADAEDQRHPAEAPAGTRSRGRNEVPFGQGGPVSGPYGNVQRQRGQGRIRLHRRRRRFRLALCLVRARGAAEGFGELAEVRSGPAHSRRRNACTSPST